MTSRRSEPSVGIFSPGVAHSSASFVLLVGTAVVYQQIRFMRSQDLGLKPQQVLVIERPVLQDGDSLSYHRMEVFRKELLNQAAVTTVARSGAVPGISMHELSTSSGITRLGAEKKSGYNYYLYGIDAYFLPTLQIELAEGRNFRPGSPREDEVILNEEAVRLLGFKNAREAIGEQLSFKAVIVGVVKNFHQRSLKKGHLPMILISRPKGGSLFSVRLNTKEVHRSVEEIEQVWKKLFPGHPFRYQFLDELFDRQYQADLQFERLSILFTGLTMFIACLGLLGLASYSTLLRTKEIGIRKILGATVSQVVVLLSRDFLKLVSLSVVLATPLAWLVTHKWLENYATRISPGWSVFAVAGCLALLTALLTISFQAVKAALANPIKSLRSE